MRPIILVAVTIAVGVTAGIAIGKYAPTQQEEAKPSYAVVSYEEDGDINIVDKGITLKECIEEVRVWNDFDANRFNRVVYNCESNANT